MIEISTRGQCDNPKWLQASEGRITASMFGRICKMRPTKAPDNVVREIMGYKKRVPWEPVSPLKSCPSALVTA